MQTASQGWRTGPLAIGLVAIGVVASILVGISVAAGNGVAADQWLQDRGEVVQASTEGTVKTAIDGLAALAAFFENSSYVTEEEFDGFVSSLDPAIRLLGVAYVPRVPREELEAYVAERRLVDAGYSVIGLDESGDVQPVSLDREVYYPVERFYIGPFLLQAVADTKAQVAALSIGYDAGSPEEWLPSLEFAASVDTPTVSAFVDVGAGDSMLGKAFIVSVPVHDESGAVIGLVAAPMVDFLLATEAQFDLTRSVTWTISSGETGSPEMVGPVWEQRIELPGAVWNLVVVPTDAALSELSGIPRWKVIFVGFLITGLVTYLFVLWRQRSRQRGQMEEMERLARDKDRFLASVSHEIRTPLTVVAGLAHELRDRSHSFQAGEVKELLSMIARQSDEVAAIVEDLLVAARADFGMVAIASETVDLHGEASRVIEGFSITAQIVGDRTWAWADPSRVRQILRNLVSNAQRYGGSEKQVRLGSKDGESWIEVADSGSPIPMDERIRIFHPYVTSSDSSEPGVGAMGLGLFISQRLAELLGGRLTYEHDGMFSVFRLTLPAAEGRVSQSAA